jgi:histidine triad (HIT) family protein
MEGAAASTNPDEASTAARSSYFRHLHSSIARRFKRQRTHHPTMSEDCIFCAIVAGDIPGRVVGETDDALAFLDANPMAPGHTLVVPKAHRQRVADLSREESRAVFDLVHELAPRIEAAVDADAHTIAVNDGPEAGQEVPHAHVHIIPRFADDDGGPIHAVAGSRPDLSEEELDDIAESVSG